MDGYFPENLFNSEYKPVLPSYITVPNKTSLSNNNSLSENSTHNQDKQSQDYFEGQNISYAIENYEAKTIVNTTSNGGVHTIILALETKNPITQQIVKVPVLLLKKGEESVAKSIYYLKDERPGFPLYINLQALSTFCGQG